MSEGHWQQIDLSIRELRPEVERKKKEFSHDLVTTPIRPSNQLKQNEICGLRLEMDVHSTLWLRVQGSFFGFNPQFLSPYA